MSEFRLSDPGVAASVPAEKAAARWLGEEGAGELQIQALEQRLGRELPPSYRGFPAASNGFRQQSSFIYRLYGAEEVEWFGVRNAPWAEAYWELYPGLGECLQVSEVGDAAVVLLNPTVVAADGEWQVYFLANWVPGVRMYENFGMFMQEEVSSSCEWRVE